jgi:hypothetical protein
MPVRQRAMNGGFSECCCRVMQAAPMKIIAPIALALLSLSGAPAAPALAQQGALRAPPADVWEIGPVIRGRNHSVGMPPSPSPVRGGDWAFDFPVGSEAAGHVHYVTAPAPDLSRFSRISYTYRVEAAPGTRFIPRETPEVPATVSLYIQRRGDDWSGRRGYAHYRWFAPSTHVMPLAPGTFRVTISLSDPGWTQVWGQPAANHPREFADALADAERIGLLFGSSSARGHGVYASRRARFVLVDLRME